MELHTYSPKSGEYISTKDARQNPRPTSPHDQFLLPANATFKTPKSVTKYETNVFNSELDEWEIKPDYRDEVYYLKSDGSKVTFKLGEEPDLITMQDTFPANIQVEIDTRQILDEKKATRDETLNSLTHDFLDGRVIQVRPKDESNIRNAIEVMTANNMTTISWVMVDDVKYDVTIPELQTALQSGQMQALSIWGSYNP